MTIREILTSSNPLLGVRADPVTVFDTTLKELIEDMKQTAEAHHACGLAATQIGVNQRVMIVDRNEGWYFRNVKGKHVRKLDWFTMINPEFEYGGGDIISSIEGCWSVPGKNFMVPRHDRVVVRCLDEDYNECYYGATYSVAVITQHVLDHLDGILISERGTIAFGNVKRDEKLGL